MHKKGFKRLWEAMEKLRENMLRQLTNQQLQLKPQKRLKPQRLQGNDYYLLVGNIAGNYIL